jgi:DEAD/DEAH box helicase domain-containing protein
MTNERISEYITALKTSARIGEEVVYHRELKALAAEYAANRRPWPPAIQALLAAQGINELYAHQALATDHIRAGRSVVVATPTASGKTFIYNLPVIERFLQDPDTKALYLFPLKALAQDQLNTFAKLTEHWPKDARPTAAIYDGDTSAHFRRKIRNQPPTAILSNPEMLHLSILPHHEQWAQFIASLQFIVVDEVHTYRGVMGAHMAQLFRRLIRICGQYGVQPTFIFCSATVGNPGELCKQLSGLDVTVITNSGAPRGNRHVIFMDPKESPSTAAIMLLKAALARGMRTIVYTQSRKMTELLALWAGNNSGPFKNRISAYRAGFLPEERREIEKKLASGELLAVISTSALELGIDVGALDLCILVGYPGTVMSTLQRGGRVGRAQQDSAVVLIAGEDALDQYFMRHPQDFFDRPPECAVVNPKNPVILKRHLECAAAELSLRADEPWLSCASVQQAITALENEGLLLRNADGDTIVASRKRPQRHVDLRGGGNTFHIEAPDGTIIGNVDGIRAFRETHAGAVYLHKGKTWTITHLDLDTCTIKATPAHVDYYTRVRGNKNTEILDVFEQKQVWGTRICFGKVRVTEHISGYEKRATRGGKLLGINTLDFPPFVFETEGLWFEIPLDVQRDLEDQFFHFMGAIHALEHAAIGILPLLVMADRNDLGGISTPMHPQVAKPAVFIYDGLPGGAGLTREAYHQAEPMLDRTQRTIADCPCEVGCPSCVHSPKCGSGNRPIDKSGAHYLLTVLAKYPTSFPPEAPFILQAPPKQIVPNAFGIGLPKVHKHINNTDLSITPERYAVLDVETQRSAQEVGGWHKADKMRVSVAVVYYSDTAHFEHYSEETIPQMLEALRRYDLIIGFNISRFDYKVLSRYSAFDLHSLPTLDMLDVIKKRLSYRVSLDNLGAATLNAPKSADGLQALQWWKEGKIDMIAKYCEKDVAITHDIYTSGRDNGYLLFTNKSGQKVRVPVEWS